MTEEKQERICPMMSNRLLRAITGEEKFIGVVPCIKEKCALWKQTYSVNDGLTHCECGLINRG